jgi:hypothetical protein
VQIDDTTTIMEINVEMSDTSTMQSNNGYYIAQLTAATHTIDIDYCGESSGTTNYIRRARIEMWRVA